MVGTRTKRAGHTASQFAGVASRLNSWEILAAWGFALRVSVRQNSAMALCMRPYSENAEGNLEAWLIPLVSADFWFFLEFDNLKFEGSALYCRFSLSPLLSRPLLLIGRPSCLEMQRAQSLWALGLRFLSKSWVCFGPGLAMVSPQGLWVSGFGIGFSEQLRVPPPSYRLPPPEGYAGT